MAIEAKDGCCQEASLHAPEGMYLPCNKPALAVVKFPDESLCRVCESCLDHAVKNRGAVKTRRKVTTKVETVAPPVVKPEPDADAPEIVPALAEFPDGKIDRTCWIDELPMKIYHSNCCAGPSVSSGDLVTIEEKGLKIYYGTSYNNPKRYIVKDKPAYILGRLAHCAILGDEVFSQNFALKPFDFRSKEQKAWRDQKIAEGITIVTQDEYDTARRMADELAKDPLAVSILEGGIPERTFVKKVGDIYIKARPDALERGSLTIADYKKSRRETQGLLFKDITNFGYVMKMANIGDCVLANTPGDAKTIFDFTYVFIMQNDEPPYTVTTVKIEPRGAIQINGDVTSESKAATGAVRDSIYWAACQNRRSVNRIAEAFATDEWPAPHGGGPVSYSYPQWLCDKLAREQSQGLLPHLDESLREIS